MSETRGIYETKPMPEPVFNTVKEIERETLAVYRRGQSYGWGDGMAEQAAAEFYTYQVARLQLRKLEAEAIETVCAWCHRHMSGPVGAPPERTSHGICARCAEREFPGEVTA